MKWWRLHKDGSPVSDSVSKKGRDYLGSQIQKGEMFRVKGLVEQAAGKTNKTKSQNETKPREWLEEIKTVRVG